MLNLRPRTALHAVEEEPRCGEPKGARTSPTGTVQRWELQRGAHRGRRCSTEGGHEALDAAALRVGRPRRASRSPKAMNSRSAPVRRRRSQNLRNGTDQEVSTKKKRTKRVSPPRRRPSTGRQDEDRKPIKKICTPQTTIKTAAKAAVKPTVKPASKVLPKAARKPSPKPTRKKRDEDVLVVKKPSPRKKPGGRTSGAVLAGLCDVFSTKCDLKEETKTRTRLGLRSKQDLWPAPRAHRVASLNAMAKVHILYENESRPPHGEDMPSQGLVEDSCFRALAPRTNKNRAVDKPKPRLGKRKREMVDLDVEIIDTRQCRRMASLNAQAIMAASYSQERSRIRKYEKESSCEMKVVHHHEEEIVVVQTKTVHRKVHEKSESPDSDGSSARGSRRDVSRQRPASSASSSQSVAVSEYREVVHINTTKEVKDEQEKEAAAVTHMYRYHTKATCLQMQTTYSGEPPGPPPAILGPQGYYAGYPTAGPPTQAAPATPALLAAPAVTTATGAYTVDRGMVVSVAPIHRHYGSAFTVPRYGHALPYAAPVEYVPNYFQPAGPMIHAPGHEQCLIHKPVPFHPQQHLAPVGPPPPFPAGPPTAQPPHCFAERLAGPSSPPHGGGGSNSTSFPPFAPPFPPPYRQAPPPATSPTPDAGTSYQIKMASTAAPSAAVPKSEPVTPPETKSPPQGNEFSDASKALGKDAGKEGSTTLPFRPESALMAPSVVAKKGQRAPRSTSEKTKTAQRRSEKTTLAEAKTSEKKLPKVVKRNMTKQPSETEESEKVHGKNGFKGQPLAESARNCEKKRTKQTDKEAQTVVRQEEPESDENEASVASGEAATVVAEQEGEQATSKTKKNASPPQSKAASTVAVLPRLPLCRKQPRRKFAHGWSWDGEPFQKVVVVNNEDTPQERTCFPAMRHMEGDVIRVRDCVLLRSGTRKIDLPFVAKVAALWENDDDGEMMMSLLWYYRPEHTDQGRKSHHMEDEIFASKHRDCNSVACIEDKCYVLTFAEYCRYRARMKLLEEGCWPRVAVVPDLEQGYARRDRLPPGRMDPQLVFFCRRVYDFRQRRILKNPS